MGIGNVTNPASTFGPTRLITPHGDRERGPAAGREPAAEAHYPSWGSGTSVSGVRPCQFSISSLPLMGIGNTAGTGRSSRRSPPHYPSWGSGTDQPRIKVRQLRSSSLPLMGIGNFRLVNAVIRLTDLITPHGDRELCWMTWETAFRQAHYPSWGSGTRRSFPGAFSPHLDLITPHGDREHSRPTARYVSRFTHYPSWGSGTITTALHVLVRFSGSLPLMGIGNAVHPVLNPLLLETHYPSWGSGTSRVA